MAKELSPERVAEIEKHNAGVTQRIEAGTYKPFMFAENKKKKKKAKKKK